jgi:hypothetical protein
MRWESHVADMRGFGRKNIILTEKPKGKRRLGRKSVDGRIILKWSLQSR